MTEELTGAAVSAAGGVYACHVRMAGAAQDGKVYLWLESSTSDGTPFKGWYYASPKVKDEILDTALTAISANLTLLVGFTSIDPYSQLEFVYVQRWA